MNKQEFIKNHDENKYHQILGDITRLVETTKGIFDIRDSLAAVYYLRNSINENKQEEKDYLKVSEALDLYEENLKNKE